MKRKKSVVLLLSLSCATTTIGCASWVANYYYNYVQTNKVQDIPVAYIIGKEDVKYTTIEKALEVAQSGDIVCVIPPTKENYNSSTNPIVPDSVTYEISRSCEIKEGVTLFIPTDKTTADTITSQTKLASLISLMDTDNRQDSQYSRGDASSYTAHAYSNKQRYLRTTIVLKENVTLVNKGKLIISGFLSSGSTNGGMIGHTSHSYTRILMESNSKITQEGSTSETRCYGYIEEASSNNNSEVILNNGVLYIPFIVKDYRGFNFSWAMTDSSNNAVDTYHCSPFNQWELVNISSKVTCNYNTNVIGIANFYVYYKAGNLGTVDKCYRKEINLVGNSSSDFVQFNDTNYSSLIIKYTRSTDDYKMDFYGGCILNTISLSIKETSIITVKVDLSSTQTFFPVSYKFKISFNKNSLQTNATYDFTKQRIKLLPGCNVTINDNCEVNASSIIVYSSFYDGSIGNNKDSLNSYGSLKYPLKNGAILVNKGILNSTNLGGVIYCDNISNVSYTTNWILSNEAWCTTSSGKTNPAWTIADYLEIREKLNIYPLDFINKNKLYIGVNTFQNSNSFIPKANIVINEKKHLIDTYQNVIFLEENDNGYKIDLVANIYKAMNIESRYVKNSDVSINYDRPYVCLINSNLNISNNNSGINEFNVQSIEIECKTALIDGQIPLFVDTSIQLAASIIDIDKVYEKNITWGCLNPEIATIDQNGQLTGVSLGSCIVWAECDGLRTTRTFEVISQSNVTPLESIEITSSNGESSNTIKGTSDNFSYHGGAYSKNSEITLKANINPVEATITSLTWKYEILSVHADKTMYLKGDSSKTHQTNITGIDNKEVVIYFNTDAGTTADYIKITLIIEGYDSNGIQIKKEAIFVLKQKADCYKKGTQILTDKGYKLIEEIDYKDRLLTWNFYDGQFEYQNIAIIVRHGISVYSVVDLSFSNGKVISIIADHGFFDIDLNKFIYITKDNYRNYIGHRFVYYKNGKNEITSLTNGRVYIEKTDAFSITSTNNYNVIANSMLTCPPPGEFYNFVKMGEKLRIDVNAFNKDVKTYGLYDYDVFEPYGITYETFIAFNGPYLKIPVEKGIFTFDYIINLFNQYKSWI